MASTKRNIAFRFVRVDSSKGDMMNCELCRCEEAHNFHHFIPRTLHSNKWFKRRFSREQMREGLDLCKSCHRAIHDLIPSEKELGRDYNTREKLLAHPQIAEYIKWKRQRRRGRASSKGNRI
jgi:hypothetical protein